MVYKMNITQQHIDDGFAIGANSAQGSRFKLLLFQQCSDGEWGQLAQVSSDPSCQPRVQTLLYRPSLHNVGLLTQHVCKPFIS